MMPTLTAIIKHYFRLTPTKLSMLLLTILLILSIRLVLQIARKSSLSSPEKSDLKLIHVLMEASAARGDQETCSIPGLTPGGKNNETYNWNLQGVNAGYIPTCVKEENLRLFIDFNNYLVKLNPEDSFWSGKECFYQHVVRLKDRPDFHYKFNFPHYEINATRTKLPDNTEHIRVWCIHSRLSRNVYNDYLSSVAIIPELEARLGKLTKPGEEFYSVMILGQGSSSHMNFRRYMPQSHSYLVDEMGAIEFDMFQSLGTETKMSVLPLLTGLSLAEYKDACWKSLSAYHDDCPFIWKDFAQKGFRTFYDEDSLDVGIFNGKGCGGFQFQPFDYDFRAVGNFLHRSARGHYTVKKEAACYGSRLAFSVLLENMLKFLRKFKDRRHFSFIWEQSLTKDNNHLSVYGDVPFLGALKYIKEQRLLEDTIFILFSDHGMDHGEFAQKTSQGLLEERLPILYVVLPQKFKKKYPLAAETLRSNSKRLTSAFDIHATLLDVLNLSEINDPRLKKRTDDQNLKNARNVSLFLPINPQRTCDTMGLSKSFCACLNRRWISKESEGATAAAEYLVDHINQKLSHLDQCHHLRLQTVTGAAEVTSSMGRTGTSEAKHGKLLVQNETIFTAWEISFDTKPGRGVFLGVISLEVGKGELAVDDVRRTGDYGLDGYCIQDKHLKPFCHCKLEVVEVN